MARYLTLVLEGTPGRAVAKRLEAAGADVATQDTITRITLRGLPGAPVEEVLRALGEAGLRRSSGPVRLGTMPRHVDDPAEIAAWLVEADFADLPANPEKDFEPPVHRNRACRFLREDRTLLVSVKPKGHIAQYGNVTVVDPGVLEWIERYGRDIVTGPVQWKKERLDWVQLREAARAAILDPRWSFNPEQASRPCGLPTIPLRSPLIARADLDVDGFVRDERGRSLEGRGAIYLAGTRAMAELTARYSKGYAAEPVYTADGPTARYARDIDHLIREYLGG